MRCIPENRGVRGWSWYDTPHPPYSTNVTGGAVLLHWDNVTYLCPMTMGKKKCFISCTPRVVWWNRLFREEEDLELQEWLNYHMYLNSVFVELYIHTMWLWYSSKHFIHNNIRLHDFFQLGWECEEVSTLRKIDVFRRTEHVRKLRNELQTSFRLQDCPSNGSELISKHISDVKTSLKVSEKFVTKIDVFIQT